ncbi:MAG: glycosyl hydrolase [Chlorobi bacterium OLB5]|nr:MAG: glycosyl hydrolase [Chlorobi bacterium OLB5]
MFIPFKYILLFAAFFSFKLILSQQIDFSSVPSEVNNRNSFLREKWFIEQRVFPFQNFPENAYYNACQQKVNILQNNGYYSREGSWVSIGPTPAYNINYGNVSSRIASVKFHPFNPDIIYLAAAFGGVWKTTNAGLNWYPKTDFEPTLSSGALAIDKNDPEVIYYGTGEASYFTYSYSGLGLLKTTNGGNNWLHITAGLPANTYFSRLVIDPNNSSRLFAALGNAGLYKSSDAGLTWQQSVTGRCDDVIFTPDGAKLYIIGQGCGYRISNDSGNTFTLHTPYTLGTRNHIAICASVPEIMYSVSYQGTTATVFKSTNSGINFTQLQNNFTGANQGWYDLYIYVNPVNPNLVYLGLIDIWRSTNGSVFSRITNTSAGPVHVDHHNMDFNPLNPADIIFATDGGIYRSTNAGNNWMNINSNLNLTQFYRVASNPSNSSHLIGGTQDNGVQQTTGSPVWNVWLYGGDGGDACFQSINNNFLLAENQFNRIKRSTDSGLNWSVDTTGLFGRAAWIAPIVSHPDSAGIFYTAREQVFKSTDNGDNWFPISAGTAGIISHLDISERSPEYIYAVSNNIVFLSSNGGINFEYRIDGLPVRTITGIKFHPDSSAAAIITFSGFGSGHIYKTTNYGVNWFDISGNLPDIPFNDCLFYYPGYNTNTIIAASDIGVFVTHDFGESWSELASGLPNTAVFHLDHNRLNNKLRAATHGRGVWEFNGEIIPVIQVNNEVPKLYSLSQNYPNPFNPKTVIKFSIPALETTRWVVSLKIHDILGREITTLVNQNLSPGTYTVEWNAPNYPNGLYFYTLRSGDYSETKKMILIK